MNNDSNKYDVEVLCVNYVVKVMVVKEMEVVVVLVVVVGMAVVDV